MDYFDREALKSLAHTQDDPCVSLYMPTYHVEAELSQNAIRLKNLARQARQQLKEAGYREAEVEGLLQPLHDLLEHTNGWGPLSDGLAAFITSSSAYFYRIPLAPKELVVTGPRFHLKPLFPLLASNNRFYVLALSQNRVRLYQGTHQTISEVHAEEFPKSLVDALAYDEPERSLQLHIGKRVGGRHDAIFHGHGQGVQDEDKRRHEELKRYFGQIDTALHNVLRYEDAPLMLAGVEYYLPIYREVNSYKHLIEDHMIAGNPDHLAPHQLHEKAWDLVEPAFHRAQSTSLGQFQQAFRRNGLASDDVREIIPAAVYSRVETLFVSIGMHLWGRYDADNNVVSIHEAQQPGDDDLFNFAAVQTYLNGGTVHALQPENMPVESGLAATFRFPAHVEAQES